MMYDWPDEDRGYLDTTDFAKYCLSVHKAIRFLTPHNAGTIGNIKRRFASRNDHRWLMDAIDSLTGIGSITQTTFVSPLKWIVKELPAAKSKKRWNAGARSYPKTPGPDTESMFRRKS